MGDLFKASEITKDVVMNPTEIAKERLSSDIRALDCYIEVITYQNTKINQTVS